MLVLLAAFALAAALAPVLVARLGPRAFSLLAVVPLAAVVWAAAHIRDVTREGRIATAGLDWIPELGVRLAFRLDALALVMVLVVAGVGTLVLLYCARYFAPGSPGLGRFAGVLVAFAGAMLGLVLADDLISLYVFWELTTIGSFLLVGHATDQGGARRAAIDALVVTTFGGLAMLVGFVMLGSAGGTLSISELVANAPSGPLVEVALILVVLGAITKSALFPFHFWLPGAMAAPTPVSAYLHAAAMVKAGPYLVARLMPGFVDVPGWRTVVVVLGVVTMLAGAWRALRQFDVKLLLAHGTVSQLGLLMVLFGAGTPNAALAGLAMLLAHAMYKATLFLVVGAVDKGTGTRDLRVLSGLGRADKRLAAVTLLGALSMAGFPPLLGFAAKESVYEAFEHGSTTDTLLLIALGLGSLLTVAYAIRFAWGVLADKPGCEARPLARPRGMLLGAPALLAVGGLVAGVLAGGLDLLLQSYATWPVTVPPVEAASNGSSVTLLASVSLRFEHPGIHVAAWHGLGLPLLITVLALLGGAAFFAVRGVLDPVQQRLARAFDARDAYVEVVEALERLALRTTVVTQTGSLPVYLAMICMVLIAGAVVALVTGAPWEVHLQAWDSPAQGAVVAVLLVAAVLAVGARRRLKAVAIVGVVGYGIALVFALGGAPDLALTQFLAETLTLVVVVLVLRRLPPKFSVRSTSPARRRVNVALGLGVGVVMALLTVVATGAREAPPVSANFPPAAKEAGGKNLVNVTLVDFRAWDTMGETGVLVVAATGVTSLIFLGRRRRTLPRRDEVDDVPTERPERTWLQAEETVDPARRSLLLEVAARVTFHTIWVVAIYLLIAGHDLPGGGFAGGIVAGLALVVRYLAGGRYELAETLPVRAGTLIGLGLVIATGYALLGAVLGDAVLQSHVWQFSVPALGDVKLVASTAFDVGIFCVVVGVVLDVLRAFGAEIDRHEAVGS